MTDLKSVACKGVWVQVPLVVLKINLNQLKILIMDTYKIIAIMISVTLIIYALVLIVYKCTMGIIFAIHKRPIEFSLAIPCYILTISTLILVLNFLI